MTRDSKGDRRPDDLDATLRAALAVPPKGCPDLETLAAHDADGPESWALAAHVATCSRCAAIVDARRAPTPVLAPTPAREARLKAAARAVYQPERPGVIKMTLRAIGRALEVLDLVGEVLEPVPVRSGAREGVLVRQRFGGHEVTAHVSVSEKAGGGFAILLDVWQPPDAPQTVRFSLFRGTRELASEVPRKGRALLPPVRAGQYRVVISDADGYVGEMDLTFEDEAA